MVETHPVKVMILSVLREETDSFLLLMGFEAGVSDRKIVQMVCNLHMKRYGERVREAYVYDVIRKEAERDDPLWTGGSEGRVPNFRSREDKGFWEREIKDLKRSFSGA